MRENGTTRSATHARSDSPRYTTISTAVVRTLVQVVEDSGVTRATFLRLGGLEPSFLSTSDARLSGARVYALCELALDLTGDPALSFRWADELHGALGPVSHLIAHAATLRLGLEALTKFSRLVSDHTAHELVEDEETATLRCGWLPGSPRMQRFSAEIVLAFLFRILRDFDRHAQPQRVSFQHAAPAYRSEYARVFRDRECFDQPFTGIVFERGLLDHPARHQDDDLHEAVQAIAEQRLHRLSHQMPYTLRVRQQLMRNSTPNRADMATVAQALGMSVRSLHRRLAAEGQSYNDVANEALALVAKQSLCSTQRSIQEIAYEMGFSDARSFHRAFKRWTGRTPGDYRDHCAAKRDEGWRAS